MRGKPVWLEAFQHNAVRTLAIFRGATIQDIISTAMTRYAATLSGKEKELYDRALTGQGFDRDELKLYGRVARKKGAV